MLIMCGIFLQAFNHHNHNFNTTTDYEWLPPNCQLLNHPSLSNDNSLPSLPAPELPVNIVNGMAADAISTLYLAFVKSGDTKKAQEKRIWECESIANRFKMVKPLSSGVLAKNGIHSLKIWTL